MTIEERHQQAFDDVYVKMILSKSPESLANRNAQITQDIAIEYQKWLQENCYLNASTLTHYPTGEWKPNTLFDRFRKEMGL